MTEAAVLKMKITALEITVTYFFSSWQTNAKQGGGCRQKEENVFFMVIHGERPPMLLVLFLFYNSQMVNEGLSQRVLHQFVFIVLCHIFTPLT